MSQGRDDFVIHIEGLFPQLDRHTESKPKIFVLDDHRRKANKKDYEPEKVSIGPLHYSNYNVRGMKKHKVRFLHELLLERKDLSLEMLVDELREMEGDARRCYPERLDLDKKEVMEILFLDGCFIIQLMRRYFFRRFNNDPIFKSQMLIQIAHDLLLFENQLPFFVLTRLFDKIKTRDSDENFLNVILFFFKEIVPWLDLDHSKTEFPRGQPDHLLELVHSLISTKIPHNHRSYSPAESYNPPVIDKNSASTEFPRGQLDHLLELVHSLISTKIPHNHRSYSPAESYNPPVIDKNSASELMDFGGIVLKMSKDNRLTFSGKVLSVPPLHVNRKTESLLWNVMAYEQLQLKDENPRHVTDYMFFLHCLTRSIKDVEILQDGRIVRNYIGGSEKILQMFDHLGTNSMRSDKYTYSHIFESLNKHCSSRCNRHMASLKRNYFNTPWSVIKLLAATFLLLLTVAQTVLAVLSFREQKP